MRAVLGDRHIDKAHKQSDPAFHSYVEEEIMHGTTEVAQRLRNFRGLTADHTTRGIPFRRRYLKEE